MIGIVICNFNKKDYVINCIKSVLSQDFQDFDIYVVDNASTDGSAGAVREQFPDGRVNLIQNPVNLGGSGGFNAGLRECLKKDYEYLMCMDNDVLMEEGAISALYSFMEQNRDVGMAGSKVCAMDEPDRVQALGAAIDFESYGFRDLYRGRLDDGALPGVQYCDYVPACSLMARTDAVRKVGVMPEDNFIYWDDVEWGYRFGLAGYRVAAVSASKVLHKGGKSLNPTTFQKYYMFRNRLNFFMKYLPEGRRGHFVEAILKELYRSVCSCHLKKDDNMLRTFMYAYDDALHGVRGVADPCKILPRHPEDRFKEAVESTSRVAVVFDGNFAGLSTLKSKLERMGVGPSQVTVVNGSSVPSEKLAAQYEGFAVADRLEDAAYDVLFQMCPHIFQAGDAIEGAVCVDQWLNILVTEKDYALAKDFEAGQELFLLMNRDVWMECIRKSC